MREGWTVDLLVAGTFYSSTSTLLSNRSHRVLVDTGLSSQQEELLKALRVRGLTPEDIDIIINTHLHLDHCSNNALFPRATIFLSHSEWTWMNSLYQTILQSDAPHRTLAQFYPEIDSYGFTARRIRNVVSLVRHFWDPHRVGPEDRFHWIESNSLPAGLEVLATPGHTPHHISIRVLSPPTIVAGDAVLNYDKEARVATMIPHLREQFLTTQAEILRFGGEIIPGHGAPFVPKIVA